MSRLLVRRFVAGLKRADRPVEVVRREGKARRFNRLNLLVQQKRGTLAGAFGVAVAEDEQLEVRAGFKVAAVVEHRHITPAVAACGEWRPALQVIGLSHQLCAFIEAKLEGWETHKSYLMF